MIVLRKIKRKGQIAATLTWFAAFIVIFFVMLLFAAGTAFLVAKKVVPVIGEKNQINIGGEAYNVGNFKAQRALDGILGRVTGVSGVGGEAEGKSASVRELAVFWVLHEEEKDKSEKVANIIADEARKALESVPESERCYASSADYSGSMYLVAPKVKVEVAVQEKGKGEAGEVISLDKYKLNLMVKC